MLCPHGFLKTNPDSVSMIKNNMLHTRTPPIFQRLFLCFHGCAVGSAASCRPFLGFNGCHLKGSYGGVLLATIGIDANL